MRARAPVTIVVVLAGASAGCDLKMDARVIGMKEGAKDVVVVHVKTDKGTELTCSGDACGKAVVPASGEMDLDVRKPPDNREQQVFVNGEHGMKSGRVMVDLVAGMPPELKIEHGYGTLSCKPRLCDGKLTMTDVPRLSISQLPPGSVVDLGGAKQTVPASGKLEAPIALSPPLPDLPLTKVCFGAPIDNSTGPELASFDLAITFPDGARAATKAPFEARLAQRGLALMLGAITKGPVAFPWSSPAKKRAGVHVFGDRCWAGGVDVATLTVADIDVISVAELEPERTSDCVYDVTEANGKKRIMKTPIRVVDKKATAFDRKTGEKLGEKLFIALEDCREHIRFRGKTLNANDQPTSYAADAPIADWAASFLK